MNDFTLYNLKAMGDATVAETVAYYEIGCGSYIEVSDEEFMMFGRDIRRANIEFLVTSMEVEYDKGKIVNWRGKR